MVTLFISPKRPPNEHAESEYTIEIERYSKAIRKNWPEATVYVPTEGSYPLRWELNTKNHQGILGGIQSDKQTVSFGANFLDSALRFIRWHRQYVPGEVPLFLFDENLMLIHRLGTMDQHDDLKHIITDNIN